MLCLHVYIYIYKYASIHITSWRLNTIKYCILLGHRMMFQTHELSESMLQCGIFEWV